MVRKIDPANTSLDFIDDERTTVAFFEKGTKNIIGKPMSYEAYGLLSYKFKDPIEFKQFLLDLPDSAWDGIHMVPYFSSITAARGDKCR